MAFLTTIFRLNMICIVFMWKNVSRQVRMGLLERWRLEILIAKSKNILFGSLYRPPNSSQFISADFNAKLEDTLGLATTENKEILLVGDLNANFLPRQSTDRISREVKGLVKRHWYVTAYQGTH